MWLRLAALAALTVVLCIPAHAQPPAVVQPAILTLDDAFARIDPSHPERRLLQGQRAVLGAERDRASLHPPLVAGASIENALGSGETGGFKWADITLSLASVLERGGKLDAHEMLAKRRRL